MPFVLTPNATLTPSVPSYGSESEGDRKKRRKWEDFSEKLMRCVLRKQEDLQKKFLEVIDKFERERVAREEEWKMREMARFKREHELLMQERSISAAKDVAILAFLQKISDRGKLVRATQRQTEENPSQENPSQENGSQENPSQENGSQEKPSQENESQENQSQENPSQDIKAICINEKGSGENSSSRWPKEEVEALIMIRSALDLGYNGTKGPLWQDVSGAMKKIGYDRNAKRCKEKWENINKYYKRVKDGNKERPIDSKTCPYFHLLDDLYSKRTKRLDQSSDTSVGNLKPDEILMHMMNRLHSGRDQRIQLEHVVLEQDQEELISVHDQILHANDQVME